MQYKCISAFVEAGSEPEVHFAPLMSLLYHLTSWQTFSKNMETDSLHGVLLLWPTHRSTKVTTKQGRTLG